MDNNTKLFIFLLLLIFIFYNLRIKNNKLISSHNIPHEATINETNIGFVKPEHRLLKILNNISSGSKIKFNGTCAKYVYNKNTIDTSVNNRLTRIVKDLINSVNQISQNDYYMKNIENVYCLISNNKNQRYFIDFFIYDVKNYYTIRLITDIVIIDNEIYINYLNVQTGSNPTILNKYDVKFNDTGILFDGDMFKENIDSLFDSFYRQSFHVIGISNTSLEYSKEDLTTVLSLKSLKNMYLPSNLSPGSIKELDAKDLTGYIEMYLPENQINIKSPMFCDKYKMEWNSYGIPNQSDTTDTGCYVNHGATSTTYNQPWNPPGLMNNNRTDVTHYDWLLQRNTISNSL